MIFCFGFKIGRAHGKLTNFIIEPFIDHSQQDEYYICIYSERECDKILFHHEGGVDIGDVDSKALVMQIDIEQKPEMAEIIDKLLINIQDQAKKE
jgi:ATP citrate (pro-S)-lyase